MLPNFKPKFQCIFLILILSTIFTSVLLSQKIEKFYDNKQSLQIQPPVDGKNIERAISSIISNSPTERILNITFYNYRDNYNKIETFSKAFNNDRHTIYTSIKDDPIKQQVYILNKAGSCYIARVSEMDDDSFITKEIKSKYYKEELDYSKLFYSTCPVFADTLLVGYVSSVIYQKHNGLIADINRLEAIATTIGKILSDNLIVQ